MKRRLSLILILMMVFCINASTFAMADTDVEYHGETANFEFSVIDGQSVKTVIVGDSERVMDVEGYTKNKCEFDGKSVSIDGNVAATVTMEDVSQIGTDDSNQTRGYTRQANPAFGTDKDYTVSQGYTTKNIEVTTKVAQATVTIVSKAIQLFLPAAAGLAKVAEKIINLALDIGSNTPTIYLKEFKYGHKTIPALYHKYTQKWYLSSSYSGLYIESTVYDYWS